jgi:hypothetical protein
MAAMYNHEAITRPVNKRHDLVAGYLETYHHQDQASVRRVFGSVDSLLKEERFLINTVSEPEGIFAGKA